MSLLSEEQKPNPAPSLQWQLPGECESNRLLEKRSCEVVPFVSGW